MDNFLLKSFVEQINIIVVSDTRLKSELDKINGLLKKYSEDIINKNLEDLRLIDIVDDRQNLKNKLTKFIANYYVGKNPSVEKAGRRESEARTRLKRLVSKIYQVEYQKLEYRESSKLPSKSIVEIKSPEWLKPLVDILPRESDDKRIISDKNLVVYPLKENSVALLIVIIEVINTSRAESITSLFEENISQIKYKVKENFFEHSTNILNTLNSAMNRLGLKKERVVKMLKKSEWSLSFRQQWDTYAKLVINGPHSHDKLSQMIEQYELKIDLIKENTLDGYLLSLEVGLYHCNLPQEWKLEDLLTLKAKEVTFMDGTVHPVLYNEYIDNFRLREKNRYTTSKKQGYDSELFAKFRAALIGMAMYNGMFNLAEKFRKQYKVRRDRTLKDLKKAEKDKIYNLWELGNEITRLEELFNQAVDNKLYKRRAGVPAAVSNWQMDLCIFYPILLALRFLGLRQINVRNFRLMKNPKNATRPEGNIGFQGKHRLIVHFESYEIKNSRALHYEFDFEGSKQTHGQLTRGLYKYYSEVRPYIMLNAAEDLNGQFFASRKGNSSKFVRLRDSERHFSSKFARWTKKFLNFEGTNNMTSQALNAHQLRRTCINWLHQLGWSVERIANYVGDTVATVENDYLAKNRVFDSTLAVEETNLHLRAIERELEQEEDRKLFKNFIKNGEHIQSKEKEILVKEKQILERQVEESENRCEFFKSESTSWQERAILSQKSEEKLREENQILRQIVLENSYKGGIKPITE